MVAIWASVFFIAAGMLFLFWPEQLRDWSLRGRTKPLPMERVMFTKTYIVSFRVGGAVSLIVGIGLIAWWFLAKQ
jgi:hypothetical protein